MVTTAQAITVLFPNAIPLVDWIVTDEKITTWNLPEPQPTPEQLAAVTDDQVKAATLALYPYELLSLLKPEQIVAIQTSAEPLIIILRSKLQTIVSPMPMAGVDMQQALAAMVGYGIVTQEEAAKLQRGESLN